MTLPRRRLAGGLASDWALALFVSSFLAALAILKHAWLQSSAADLGIFEQYCWLLSHGYPPVGTLSAGTSAFGDHKAFVLYPLSRLYALYPCPQVLLVVQALALGGAGAIVGRLAADLGHDRAMQRIAMAVWWLYPTTLLLALADFHLDALAVPALLGMLLYAGRGAGKKERALYWACLVFALGCKDTVSFAVVGVGLWLFAERRRGLAAATIGVALGWFLVASHLGPASTSHVDQLARYAYLGHTPREVLANVARDPRLLFHEAASWDAVTYVLALLLPVAPWLGRRSLAPMLAALPHMALNLLSTQMQQRDISYQYTACITPFIVFGAVCGMPRSLAGMRHRVVRAVFVVGTFVWLARVHLFFGRYRSRLPLRAPAASAMAAIGPAERVMTTSYLATHLARRPVVDVPRDFDPSRLRAFDVLLLNESDPGDDAPSTARYIGEAQREGWRCVPAGVSGGVGGPFVSCRP